MAAPTCISCRPGVAGTRRTSSCSTAGMRRRYASMRMPQVRGGDGQDAVAIDHDLNGLTDFLVLNGRTGMGPLQLVAFFRR